MADRQRRFRFGVVGESIRSSQQLAGMTFDAAGVRVSRLEESLRVLKCLFEGSPVSVSGAHYQLSGLESFPRPVQLPHPPILVGAGSRRMLGIAGREADIVGILPKAPPNGTISDELSERSPETIARKVGWVREAAAERLLRMPGLFVGPVDRVAEEMQARRERYGFSYYLVSDQDMEAFGPVVDRLRGR